MIKNIKILFNILLVAILSITISNIISEIPILEETVEEVKEFETHAESTFYLNNLQSVGAGGNIKINLPTVILSKKNNFQQILPPATVQLLTETYLLSSIPFFIRFCSLIIYS